MNVIDLFAGCGGFSLGFQMAGFKSKFALEIDEWASKTCKFNHPEVHILTKDIKKVNPLKLNLKKLMELLVDPHAKDFLSLEIEIQKILEIVFL